MKMTKILGVAVALAGSALSVASALALYKIEASNIDMRIGGYTYVVNNGIVEYKIGTPQVQYKNDAGTVVPDASGINPDIPTVTYQYPLGGLYNEGTFKQDFVLGSISVTSKLLSELPTGVSATITVTLSSSNNDINTWYGKWGGEGKTTFSGTLDFTESTKVLQTGWQAKENPTLADGEHLDITVTYTGLSADNFLQMAEKDAYSFSVKVADVAEDFDAAYVVGTMSNWGLKDEYRMVPNLKNPHNYQWMFKGLSFDKTQGTKKIEATCRTKKGLESFEGNHELKASKTYVVYWATDESGHTAQFNEQAG